MTTTRYSDLAVRLVELTKQRNAARRKYGTNSDTYLDIMDRIETVRDNMSELTKQEKRAAKAATAPERSITRKQKASATRQARKMRVEYSKAFQREQEEYLQGFGTDEVQEGTRQTDRANGEMIGQRNYEYSAFGGSHRARTFMVRSHVQQYDAVSVRNSQSSTQIVSDVRYIANHEALPWLRSVLEQNKGVKITTYMAALMVDPQLEEDPQQDANGLGERTGPGKRGRRHISETGEKTDYELFQTPTTVPKVFFKSDSTYKHGNDREMKAWLDRSIEEMYERIMQIPSRRLHSVLSISFATGQVARTIGGSYIKLPDAVANSKSCVNVNLGPYNGDNNKHGVNKKVFDRYQNSCFLFSVLAGLFPVEESAHCARQYMEHVNKVNMTDIAEPVAQQDIAKFMELNPTISINLLGYTAREGVHVLQLVEKDQIRENHIVLLLLMNDTGVNHYVYVKNVDRLINIDKRVRPKDPVVRKQFKGENVCSACGEGFNETRKKRWDVDPDTNEYLGAICSECQDDEEEVNERATADVSQSHGTMYHCDRCFTRYSSRDNLAEHRSRPCGDVKIEMPSAEKGKDGTPKNVIKFRNFKKRLVAPCVMYGDYETLTASIEATADEVADEVKDKEAGLSFTKREQHHKPIAGGLLVVVAEGVPDARKHERFDLFVGTDTVPNFAEQSPRDRFAPNVHVSNNCVKDFIRQVHANAVELTDNILCRNFPMTDVDVEVYNKATKCYLCKSGFTKENWKVRDHDHITGKFRGPACNNCNLQLQVDKTIPVVFHNLKGYDGPLMMRTLGQYIYEMGAELGSKWHSELKPVATTMEKYMSYKWTLQHKTGTFTTKGAEIIKKYQVRFIDSCQHLPDSLDNLGHNLPDEFKFYTNIEFGKNWKLMSQKGFYPYDHYNCVERLNETQPPPIESFASKLKGGATIKADEYAHVHKVWREMGCKSGWDYMMIYLRSDVCLLADIFQQYRGKTLCDYEVDPAHYMTCPGVGDDAALIKFEEHNAQRVKEGLQPIIRTNMTDYDMYLFEESSQRGGISMMSKRFAHVDNKYLRTMREMAKSDDVMNGKIDLDSKDTPAEQVSKTVKKMALRCAKHFLKQDGDKDHFEHGGKNYTVEREGDKFLMYVDSNNLYGGAMCEKLPTGNFRWRTEKISVEDLMAFDAEGDSGCRVRASWKYPESLHELHNDYPMAPESILVSPEMCSPFNTKLAEATNRHADTVAKLVPNLMDKAEYTCHIKNFQYYVKAGLICTAVHKVLEFDQYAYLKPYIMFNTDKRAKATNDFDKDYYKLMSNSVFGKSMENVMKRIEVDLVTSRPKFIKLMSDPRFRSSVLFEENLVAINRVKTCVKLDKPISVGATILDLSKLTMLRFHYEVMMPKYGPKKAQLLMTDTDSLCYQVETGDFYRDMQDAEFFKEFDTSNYPKDHPLYTSLRQKIVKFMKDEFGGVPQEMFVGLCPKMYSLGGIQSSYCKAKGVTKTVTKKYTVENYRQVLMDAIRVVEGDSKAKPYNMEEMFTIRPQRHMLYLLRQNKRALNAIDNKKMIAKDGITMFAYGHYLTPQIMAGEI